jgi:hypothetical protein
MITAPGVIGVAQLQQGARREHKGSKMEVSDNMGWRRCTVEVWRRWGGSTAEKWWRPGSDSGFGDRRRRWIAPTASGRLGGGEV